MFSLWYIPIIGLELVVVALLFHIIKLLKVASQHRIALIGILDVLMPYKVMEKREEGVSENIRKNLQIFADEVNLPKDIESSFEKVLSEDQKKQDY